MDDKQKLRKAVIYMVPTMVLMMVTMYLNIITIGLFQEDPTAEFIFKMLNFGLSLIVVIFFSIGLSFKAQEDEKIRRNKLIQIYIVDIIVYSLYITMIILFLEWANYLASILLGVSILVSIFILFSEQIKEYLEKAKQNQKAD